MQATAAAVVVAIFAVFTRFVRVNEWPPQNANGCIFFQTNSTSAMDLEMYIGGKSIIRSTKFQIVTKKQNKNLVQYAKYTRPNF